MPRFPIQPVVTGFFFFEKRRSESRFCCLFSMSLGWSWVIITIEIKMKSWVSLTSNLPRVIDRLNLIGRWHSANYSTLMPSFSFLFPNYTLRPFRRRRGILLYICWSVGRSVCTYMYAIMSVYLSFSKQITEEFRKTLSFTSKVMGRQTLIRY